MRAIIFEPIFRASRVQVLGWMIQALVQRGHAVTVVTRRGWQDQVALLPADLAASVRFIDAGFEIQEWYRNLSLREWRVAVKVLREQARSPDAGVVILAAADEYWLPLAMTPLKVRVPTLVVKYRMGFMLPGAHGRRAVALRATWVAMRWRRRISFAIFDEVVARRLRGVHVLPDPMPPGLEASPMERARLAFDLPLGRPVLLQIGRQDARKGLSFVIQAFPRLLQDVPAAFLWVQGAVEDSALAVKLQRLQAAFPNSVRWTKAFLSQERLGLAYSASTVILLPYTPDFTTTSGVLSCAVATRRPVVASAHGLIGHRVRENRLGEVFDYGDVEGFVRAARTVLQSDWEPNKASEAFRDASQPAAFVKQFQEALDAAT